MASQIYNTAKMLMASGQIDFDADDIRVLLLEALTTCDTENDGIDFVDEFTTLAESDDGTYARQSLAGQSVTKDDSGDRAFFDATDDAFPLAGDGTGTNYVGILIYKHVTNDADSIPIAFIEFGSTIALTAAQINLPWDAQGILESIQGVVGAGKTTNEGKRAALAGSAIWLTDSIRAILYTNLSTIPTQNDAIAFVDDYTTLGESDDTNYGARKVLAGKAANTNDTTDSGELDANDLQWAGLAGDGTGTNYVGILIYKHVTNDADSIPLHDIHFTTVIPVTANQIDIPWPATGLAQLAP